VAMARSNPHIPCTRETACTFLPMRAGGQNTTCCTALEAAAEGRLSTWALPRSMRLMSASRVERKDRVVAQRMPTVQLRRHSRLWPLQRTPHLLVRLDLVAAAAAAAAAAALEAAPRRAVVSKMRAEVSKMRAIVKRRCCHAH
jgi:hypothetical protein